MTIAFDDGAADTLITAATNAADVLQDQGSERRSAAENAADDFSGGYATLFASACGIEAEDRGRLSGVLHSLAEQASDAKTKAQEERDRLAALAAWEEREAARVEQQAVALANPTSALESPDAGVSDPKPSEIPVSPPTISAAFDAQSRTRSGRSGGGGKSSADPTKLSTFVTNSRGMNNRLETEVVAVQNAWAGFVGACSWVSFDTVSFATGFGRMVSENKADAMWVERIADQFEKAGGGGVLNSELNKAHKSTVLDIASEKKFKDLLNGKLSPEEVAEYWGSLGLTAKNVESLPPETLLKLASMSGLPAWAQDAAGQEFVDYALKHPESAYNMMGFNNPDTDPISLKDFKTQLAGIKTEINDATKRTKRLNGGTGDVVQLVDFGNHDGVLAAGISIGDLDTATNIGVNVSGMNSSVEDMTNGDKAAHELHKAAYRKDPGSSYAVVNWVGYRSPGESDVFGMGHANSGSGRLVDFLNGINASRTEGGNSPQQFNVYAHSYGSTTAAQALKSGDLHFKVDRLVTYGSAGLENDTTIDEIKVGAEKVYSTHADGDWWAKKGQLGEKGVNPIDIGAIEFSSAESVAADGKTKLKATTMHNMYSEEDRPTFWNKDGTVGYLSPGSTSLDRMANLLVNGTATK